MLARPRHPAGSSRRPRLQTVPCAVSWSSVLRLSLLSPTLLALTFSAGLFVFGVACMRWDEFTNGGLISFTVHVLFFEAMHHVA